VTEPSAQTPPADAGQDLDRDLPDFGVDDDAGNVEVERLVREVAALVDSGEIDRAEAVSRLSDGVQALSRRWPDVTDITVRENVLRDLHPVFEKAGWMVLDAYEF
jgi:hypothetical protein